MQALADALRLRQDERARFLAAARPPPAGERGSGRPEQQFVQGLPRLTFMVGREREVKTVTSLLQSNVRLLTLTGPGGVGKTRLALEVAELLRDAFADGVSVVSLASVVDPSLVAAAVATALGVRETTGSTRQESLESALAGQELLLVLDNFEQVVEAAPLLAALLAKAPRLRVLVTSRAALRLRGEHELPVQPFPAPSGETAELATSPAVTLFVERAQAVNPSFVLTASVAQTVAAICRRVDGLPLAIELAASRVKILSPDALLERLQRGASALGPGLRDMPARQQSLRATLSWSHDLLSADERVLFRRLAVFVGGWTVEAAEAVCGGKGLVAEGVLDGLAALADQSLVTPQEGPDPRVGMLETIREYASERLEESGEADAIRELHAAYFLALAERVEPKLRERGEWGALLDTEHDNLRAALRWARDRCRWDMGLRIATALAHFWFLRGQYGEGRGWLEQFLRESGGEDDASATRARALAGLAALTYNQGEYAKAAQLFEQSLALHRRLSDREATARVLADLGGVMRDWGERTRAAALQEEALTLYRDLDDRRGVAHAMVNLGMTVYFDGDLERAESLLRQSADLYRDLDDEAGLVLSLRFLGQLLAERGMKEQAAATMEESLELSRAIGDRGGTGAALNILGHLAHERGDLEGATTLFKEALRTTAGGARIGTGFTLQGLAGVEAERGRAHRAARLLGGAAALLHDTGNRPHSYLTRRTDAAADCVRGMLSDGDFAAEWEAGRRLPSEKMLAWALGER